MPWNPVGAILGPLGVLSLVALRRRGKGNKNEPYLFLFIMLVVLPVSVGMACGGGTPSSETETPPPVQTSTPTPIAGAGTDTGSGPATPIPPVQSPTPICEDCPPTPTPTSTPPPTNLTEAQKIEYIAGFGITLVGNWTGVILANLWEALFTHIGYQELKSWLNGRTATLIWGGSRDCGEMTECFGGSTSDTTITFTATGPVNPVINMLHEIGHLVDNLWYDYFTTKLEKKEFTLNGAYLAGWNGTSYTSLPRDIVNNQALYSSRVGGGRAWQQDGGISHWEDWADIFANAMVDDGNINQSSDLGGQMGAFFREMENHVMGGTP